MQLGKINGSFEGLYFDEYGLMAGILNKRSKLIEPTYILKWEKKWLARYAADAIMNANGMTPNKDNAYYDITWVQFAVVVMYTLNTHYQNERIRHS
jgi:hypothetical protein